MRILILGAGLIGNPMARDLAADDQMEILIVDQQVKRVEALRGFTNIQTEVADVTHSEILSDLCQNVDLVINALPGFLGFGTLKNLIQLGQNVVDISFFPEDAFLLNDLARQKGVTALIDCGVAPGMSNLLVGYIQTLLGKLDEVKIYVGGLPKVRQLPWEYKAVFSPIDVIEEYTRPARFKVDGRVVVKEPLTDPELIDFPQIGTLEAFNSDGLRTLLKTIDAPNMVEKTLRYPGHREKILFLKESGFLQKETIKVGNQSIKAIDFTAQILFKEWKLGDKDEDLTVMRVQGRRGNKEVRFDLLDYFDAQTGIHSMARTTGFTATIMARALLQGMISEKGIVPLEKLATNHTLVQFVLSELKKRGVKYRQIN